jgi:hypothetical protein
MQHTQEQQDMNKRRCICDQIDDPTCDSDDDDDD